MREGLNAWLRDYKDPARPRNDPLYHSQYKHMQAHIESIVDYDFAIIHVAFAYPPSSLMTLENMKRQRYHEWTKKMICFFTHSRNSPYT